MRVRERELRGAEHSQHFACFGCRKAFKQRGSQHPSLVQPGEPPRPFPCPCCQAPMVPLGRDFKAPAQRNKSQWLKVQLLHSFGIVFEVPVYHSGGPGKRPNNLADAVTFLIEHGHGRAEVESRLEELRRLRSCTSADPSRKGH